jgi:hypothetical protein
MSSSYYAAPSDSIWPWSISDTSTQTVVSSSCTELLTDSPTSQMMEETTIPAAAADAVTTINGNGSAESIINSPSIHTIQCPLLLVSPFPTSTASSKSSLPAAATTMHCTVPPHRELNGDQIATLIISIIQHLIVHLRFTSDSWNNLQLKLNQLQLQKQMESTENHLKLKQKKFINMMQALQRIFHSIQCIFTNNHSATTTTPYVKEVLLLFGSSTRNPLLAYRLILSYNNSKNVNDTIISDEHTESDLLMRSMSRHVIRQLIGYAEQLYPNNTSRALRDNSTRLHVLFRLDKHPSELFHVLGNDASLPSSIDYNTYTQTELKWNYIPKLINSFSYAWRQQQQYSSMQQQKKQKQRRQRIPKPPRRSILPISIAIGNESMQEEFQLEIEQQKQILLELVESNQYHSSPSTYCPLMSSTPTSDASAIWYQCTTSVPFERNYP